VAKLQTGGGCSLMYEVAHSMICMRTHWVCGELVNSEMTKFGEMSVDECVCWVDTAVTGRIT
jgi:hypothetical protein